MKIEHSPILGRISDWLELQAAPAEQLKWDSLDQGGRLSAMGLCEGVVGCRS
jgi:hypothetical protein